MFSKSINIAKKCSVYRSKKKFRKKCTDERRK